MPGQLALLGAVPESAGAVVVLEPESDVELEPESAVEPVPESAAAVVEVLESLVCA